MEIFEFLFVSRIKALELNGFHRWNGISSRGGNLRNFHPDEGIEPGRLAGASAVRLGKMRSLPGRFGLPVGVRFRCTQFVHAFFSCGKIGDGNEG